MDNRASEMRVFSRVVETGSFSEAGRRLHMTASAVGKMVGRIETRLGVRLIERSTRRLALTDDGQVYYDRCLQILQDMDDLDNNLSKGGSKICGTIRISASVGLGMYELEPLLPEFWAMHPNVTIDLSLSDEVVDLYLERTDLAFRVGSLPRLEPRRHPDRQLSARDSRLAAVSRKARQPQHHCGTGGA
ncbi:LysR family transcriptional regulator [Sphingomonas sp. Ant20]|uniref:LysR family transcriptional regulator n=1 Tax=Sphingomonas sp. Ant20 TaxID=104605 RepID=UPI0027418767|nr:LysR family transcriptional regulator [Sphingomonas sp. Ant20]